MLQKTRSVVLNHLKYGESGLIVRVFTEDFGRQSLLVHGVRKKKSKFNAQLFEPLSLLDTVFYFKENRELHTLKEARPNVILQHVFFDIRKSTLAIFLSEVLSRSLQEVESNKPLFDFLFHAIQILDIIEAGVENYHIVFLLQLSKFLGIYPKNNPALMDTLIGSMEQHEEFPEISLSDIGKLSLTADNRSALLDVLINYYRQHLEGMGEIKSLPVLRSVFH